MKQIIISNGSDTVRLMSDLVYEFEPKVIGERAVMASGKTVMDITGVKNVLMVPVGWLSAADLSLLKYMITRNPLLDVTWQDVDGDRTDKCYVSMPKFKSFKYGATGVDTWYGVTLEIEQAGIDPVLEG